MNNDKKFLLSLPNTTLNELNLLAEEKSLPRTAVIRDAINYYLEHEKKLRLRNMLEQGYAAMGEINLEWANYCAAADSVEQFEYEGKIGEV